MWPLQRRLKRETTYMFKRKEKIVRTEVDIQVNLVQGEIVRIAKNGTYILQIPQMLPLSYLKEITEKLKKETGAKFVVIQYNAEIWRVDK